MIDALHPAAETFKQSLALGNPISQAWADAVTAALDGAEATKSMSPRLGRASYLGERAIGSPDGGAVAVAIWLKAIQVVNS
jgi:dihydroxyacetone kinase